MNETYLLLMFFCIMAFGNWCGGLKYIVLTKSVTTLLVALLIGILSIKFFGFGHVLKEESSQIAFLQQILFLLFICATGYKIGLGIANMKVATAWRGMLTAFILATLSFGMVSVLWGMKWLDISELIGVTAGGVTQTAILEIAKRSLKEIPEQFDGKVSFAFVITYLSGTFLTIYLCRFLPQTIFHRNLVQDAAAAADDGKEPHPSSKFLLLPERQARVFFFGGNPLSIEAARSELEPITLQGIIKGDKGRPDILEHGDRLVLLADRCQLAKLPSWVKNEDMTIPLEIAKRYQYVSQSIRLRRKDECTVQEFFTRCRSLVPSLYIEQITRNKCAVDWRNPDEKLKEGDWVKLFCRREELQKMDGKVGVVIPKKADTDLVTLGGGIAAGIALGALLNGIGMGAGVCVLIAGTVMGWIHEKYPKRAGFPPQAVQLFSDFGLLGFLTLSGLAASQTISNQILNYGFLGFLRSGGRYLACGMVITCIPFFLTMLIGYRLFKRNIAVLAFSLAGCRSATPTEKELERICGQKAGGYLASSAFIIPYTFANIFLSIIGILIGRLLGS